jgi:hypothetical protein
MGKQADCPERRSICPATFSGNLYFRQKHPTTMPGQKQPTRAFNFAAKKPTMDEILASSAQLNRTSRDFLKVDLQTALTFSSIALQSTDDSVKRERNRRNARRGYDMIVRLLDRVSLTDDDAQHMTRNLVRLKTELQQLGETF